MSDCLVTIATLLYACSNEGTVDEERGKKLSVGKQHALNNFLFFDSWFDSCACVIMH